MLLSWPGGLCQPTVPCRALACVEVKKLWKAQSSAMYSYAIVFVCLSLQCHRVRPAKTFPPEQYDGSTKRVGAGHIFGAHQLGVQLLLDGSLGEAARGCHTFVSSKGKVSPGFKRGNERENISPSSCCVRSKTSRCLSDSLNITSMR